MADTSVTKALTLWKSRVDSSTSPPESPYSNFQKLWDFACCQWTLATLLNDASYTVDKARLLASMEGSSGTWLKTIPFAAVRLKLEDVAVRIAVGLRLGVCLQSVKLMSARAEPRSIVTAHMDWPVSSALVGTPGMAS